MKVEILFPEVCALFGDYGNILFLEENLGKENILKTSLLEKPRFVDEEIDLVYMGAMSEKIQVQVIEILKPYAAVLKTKIDQGMKVLFTANAMDVLGQKIIEEDKSEIEALGILQFKTVLKRNPRLNDIILGKTPMGMDIVGHKTQFTQSYGDNHLNYFIQTSIGKGINKESRSEGFVYKGLVATNLVGPLLVLNPDFAKSFLHIEVKNEAQLMKAKAQKIQDIKRYHS